VGDIDLDSYIGRPTAAGRITVERAPVAAFAAAVKDDKALYRDAEAAAAAGFEGIPTPPTYFFSAAQHHGRFHEEQPEDPTGGVDPLAEVMGGLLSKGGLILHGEQSFEYHRPVVAGEKLHHRGVVKDIYRKPTGERTMTFMVVEDTFTDDAGEPVLTATMNLIHRS
jgi:acyl dehydratase